LQTEFDAALAQAAGTVMHGTPTDVVAVFGQIGQVTEIGEGAHHTHGLVIAERFEQFFEGLVRLMVGIPAKCD
jgi:hypothetical protein